MTNLLRCTWQVRSHLSMIIPPGRAAASLLSQCVRFQLVENHCLRRCLSTGRPLWSEHTDNAKPTTTVRCALQSELSLQPPMPSHKQVVYRGQLTAQMKRLKVFSFFTSATGFFVTPTVMAEMAKAGMGIAIMMGSVMGFFTVLTPLLIHMVVRNYVTMLEHDDATDKYTATTISLFLRKRTVTFDADEVVVPSVPGMFTTFVVGGRSLFADGAHFTPMEHFGRIMGFHRPVDFKLHKPPGPPKT